MSCERWRGGVVSYFETWSNLSLFGEPTLLVSSSVSSLKFTRRKDGTGLHF